MVVKIDPVNIVAGSTRPRGNFERSKLCMPAPIGNDRRAFRAATYLTERGRDDVRCLR